jgi:hypothetical protein
MCREVQADAGRIQIASLLGYLGSEAYSIYPFLVVVPNTTITNWVREFEKWVPHMRVVSAGRTSIAVYAMSLIAGSILRRSCMYVTLPWNRCMFLLYGVGYDADV